MLYSAIRFSLILLVISLAGCASKELQQQRKQLSFDYFDCVSDKSKSLDDGVSSISDIAAGAIFTCGTYENAAVRQYDAFLEVKARNSLREGAYAVAARAISDNRKKAPPTKKATSCNMQDLHESCYSIGFAKKAEGACGEFAELAKSTTSKTITDKSVLMGVVLPMVCEWDQ
jgi:hypothetical protein